jgi:hypothetical protein
VAVLRYAKVNIGSLSLAAHPIEYIVTTTAELPSSGLKLGDTALALDTNIQYKAINTTTWVAASSPAFSKAAAFFDATAVPVMTVAVWTATYACTVTAIKGYRTGGTAAAVNAYKGTTATLLMASNLSLSSAGAWLDGGTVQNTAFAAGNSLLIGVASNTGATQITVQVNFTRP